MKNIDWKDVGIRALKTFAETAFFYIVTMFTKLNPFDGQMDAMAWFGLVLSAGAAGASAAWNGVIQPLFATLKPPEQ